MASEAAAEDLDGLVRRVDPDRWLTSRFIADAAKRADVVALYAFDHELARARRIASNPLIAEIRLTWWREALEEAFGERPVRRHPVAEALAAAVRGRGLPRQPLEAMIDGHIAALDLSSLDEAASIEWANAVAGSAARFAVLILDSRAPGDAAAPAGRAWGLAQLLRAGLVAPETVRPALRQALAEAASASGALRTQAFPAALPARLARFDLAGSTPGGLAKRLSLVLAVARGRV